MADDLMTVSELAEFLKVKRSTVRHWLKTGRLDGIKINREWRIPHSSLMAFAGANNNGETFEVISRDGLEQVQCELETHLSQLTNAIAERDYETAGGTAQKISDKAVRAQHMADTEPGYYSIIMPMLGPDGEAKVRASN